MDVDYCLLNVFTDGDDPFSGNAVTVFPDAPDLTTEQMQALATQVNIEAVFITSTDGQADASLRFFSPEKETGFAGSASLAAAAVVRQRLGGEGDVTLHEPQHGDYTVSCRDGAWTLKARPATTKPLNASHQILASLVGLSTDKIAGDVMRVDSGRSGVVLPVRSVEDVRKARLDARMLHSYAMLLNTEPQVYLWADAGDNVVESRMFYGPQGGVLEVAATGSGAANLGAWLAAHGQTGTTRRIIQGAALGRPSVVDLTVDASGGVYVGGHVRQVAGGTFDI